ncbi:MAG: VWA domain-containing protein [Actinobacteria bacterium]|uniref:Unannotated protein n=1 Tax=freshwater metagenome TaxID=449393 RepID=A0A6J7A6Q5_9ZZZZ|nr:VWA domain-containing protein [Actinomycetota bacterium]MSX86919.1 VWA domain-containing protein [Actinomycetota bacterium]
MHMARRGSIARGRGAARVCRCVSVGLLLAGITILFGVVPALAQSADPAGERVVAVDMSGATAQALVVRTSTAPTSATITVNGKAADFQGVKPAGPTYETDNVLVVDSSSTSATRFPQIKAAALDFVAGMKPGEHLAIVSASGVAQRVVPLTTDRTTLTDAINRLAPSGGSPLFDAVIIGVQLLDDQGTAPLRSVTVLAASPDGGVKTAGTVARAEAIDKRVSVNVVTLLSDDFASAKAGPYQQLSNDTGGLFVSTGDPAQFATVAKAIADQQRGLYAVTFQTDQTGSGGNVVLDVGRGPITVGFVPNTITVGSSLANTVKSDTSGLAFFQGGQGIAIAMILGAGAAALGAFALGSLFVKQEDRLQSLLQPYAEVDPDAIKGNTLAKSALFQRAVKIMSNIAERQGVLDKAEKLLEQANLPLRAAEALMFYVGVVLASTVVGLLFQRSLLGGLVLGVIGALAPPAVLNFLAKRRRKRFMMQLPDTLTLLAGTLRAGYSFMQGVEATSREVEEPMGAELRRIITEAQLGRPLEEAMDASAERMGSADFQWAVIAVRIQREVGGNLAELLITVAETMTARQRLRGEVAALTAEGKISAIVLGILPVGLGAVLFVLNPEYMRVLFDDTLGQIMFAVACVSALLGFAWMKKIINIDI